MNWAAASSAAPRGERCRLLGVGPGRCRIELGCTGVRGAIRQTLDLTSGDQDLATVGDQPGQSQQYRQQHRHKERGQTHGVPPRPR